jgi:hypothetical protein
MKRARGVVQVIQHLLSKHEALSSNTPVVPKKKKYFAYQHPQQKLGTETRNSFMLGKLKSFSFFFKQYMD